MAKAVIRTSEHNLQVLIADCLRLEIGPPGRLSSHGAIWFSVDHANYGGVAPGQRTARGVVAGLPDMFVLWRGHAFLIEIKAAGGALSEPQQTMIAAAILAGVQCAVVNNAHDVLRALDTWGVPRKRRVVLPLDEIEGDPSHA